MTKQQASRTYRKRFVVVMIAYAGLLILSLILLRSVEEQALRIAIAILPVLPIPFGIWAYLDFVRSLDELEQRIQLEAVAFSLGMTGVITFTVGFLGNADIPQFDLIWVFPMMIAFWGIGQVIANRRYA